MYQGQPATQAPVAPVQEPVPVAPVKESKSNKTSIIIACVAIILALVGMGFGVYEIIQERVKADELAKLEIEADHLRDKIYLIEAINPANFLYLSDYGIKVINPSVMGGIIEDSHHLEMTFSADYDTQAHGKYSINISGPTTDATNSKVNDVEFEIVTACDGTKEQGASSCFELNDLIIVVRVSDSVSEEIKEFFINENNYSLTHEFNGFCPRNA